MSPRILTVSVFTVCSLGLGLWQILRSPPPAGTPAAAVRPPPVRTAGAGFTPSPQEEAPPFWEDAAPPPAAAFREPAAIDPAALGVSQEIQEIDFPAELQRHENIGDTKALNALLLDWLTLDFTAARAWVEAHDTLSACQPALCQFAGRIATGGDCDFALKWVDLIEAPEHRERLLADIYSRGFQTGRFTREEINNAPVSEPERQNILNGSLRR